MKERRVRFAPSPTGPLHMGGVRTALYNYLYARQAGGKFILRIEDTDSQRFVPGAEEYIIEALRWCGIFPDEGVTPDGKIVETASEQHPHAPYRQSQRKSIYRKYAEELVEKGFAYYAFDSAEELDAMRKESEARKEPFIYNHISRMSLRNSLSLPEEETRRLLSETGNWVIRFRMPENRTVKMDDLIRGHIEVNTDTLDDKVLWKRADELPTYHLANIVDDHLMEITEVIRGEEWLPSLPLHYLLYEAFGWQDSQPRFAHLSLLLKPDGKGKLSKRDGDRLGFPVFPLQWKNAEGEISRGYREDGYYPEAFVNMLALLGWNPGTEQEIFSLKELIGAFDLDRVVKSGARFNHEKAKWFNQEYLRMKSDAELGQELGRLISESGREPGFAGKDRTELMSAPYLERICRLLKDRVCFMKELLPLSDYLFHTPEKYDEAVFRKFWNESSEDMLSQFAELMESSCECGPEETEHAIKALISEKGWKMGVAMNTLRLALVGESKGPGVAEIIDLIGRKETVERLNRLSAYGKTVRKA